MLLIMDAIIADGGDVNPYTFRKNLDTWFTTGIRECDDTTSHGAGFTLGLFWGDPKNNDTNISLSAMRICAYNPSYPFSLRSNGGLMRTCVLAIPDLGSDNYGFMVPNTVSNCSITHADPYCVTSCLFLNLLISNILKSKETDNEIVLDDLIEKILNEIVSYVSEYNFQYSRKIIRLANTKDSSDPFNEVIRESIKKNFVPINSLNLLENLKKYVHTKNLKDLDLSNKNHMSYTMIPLAVAVISLRDLISDVNNDKHNNENLFMKHMMNIVREGGDADTNCAIAGAVCGAFLGFEKLPEHMIDALAYKDYFDEKVETFLSVVGI